MVWNKRMTTSQASRVFGIPYNSLLMYVRGKYGKSLRLDVLKKNTPAANDNLNTIGNSRSTPKEKGVKKEEKDKARKPSHDGFPLFPFDSQGMNPFGGNMLSFPPLGEPLGLFGLPNTEFRIKDLMQSMQNLQSQHIAETEKIKEDLFSDSKENHDNNKNETNLPMGLASLLMKAKEFQNQQEAVEPKNSEKDEDDEEEDMESENSEIPQIAIKPVEVSPSPLCPSNPRDMKLPAPPASEISAQ